MSVIIKWMDLYPRGGVQGEATLIIDNVLRVKGILRAKSFGRGYQVEFSPEDERKLRGYCKCGTYTFKELKEVIHEAMVFRFRRLVGWDKSNAASLDRSRIDSKRGSHRRRQVLKSYSDFR
jgi:hypothetical protein